MVKTWMFFNILGLKLLSGEQISGNYNCPSKFHADCKWRWLCFNRQGCREVIFNWYWMLCYIGICFILNLKEYLCYSQGVWWYPRHGMHICSKNNPKDLPGFLLVIWLEPGDLRRCENTSLIWFSPRIKLINHDLSASVFVGSYWKYFISGYWKYWHFCYQKYWQFSKGHSVLRG